MKIKIKKFWLLWMCLLFKSNFLFSQAPNSKQWDYRYGGSLTDEIHSIQETRDKGFILGGYSFSNSGYDKTENAWGYYDCWVVKLDSMGNKEWDKDFGGDQDDVLASIQQTSDGGYIIGCDSRSDSNGNKTEHLRGPVGDFDYWIVKIDSNGNKQWDKSFGGSSPDHLSSIDVTIDGGYILGGYSGSGISGDKSQVIVGGYDYWIIKIDSLGNKEWDRDFGGTGHDYLISLQQTSDSGFILGGYSVSDSSGDKTEDTYGFNDYWIVKVDSSGNKQWDKDFGGTREDWLYSLKQTIDGGYIFGGHSISGIGGNKTSPNYGSSTNRDYWIVKTDSSGNKEWEKDLGWDDQDELINIELTKDGGYLFSGDSYSSIGGDKTESNFGVEQIWVVKTDSLGNKQWDKTIYTPGHDESGLCIQTYDGCYVFAGSSNHGAGGYKSQFSWFNEYDYWLVKFCDCNIAAIPTIAQNTDTLFVQQSFAVYQWYHDSTAISGATNYFYVALMSGNYNVIVTDSNECGTGAGILNVIASVQGLNGNKEFTISPNPTTGEFTVYFLQFAIKEISIYNLLGKKVFDEYLNTKHKTLNTNLPQGIYFVKVSSGEKSVVRKLIVE